MQSINQSIKVEFAFFLFNLWNWWL